MRSGRRPVAEKIGRGQWIVCETAAGDTCLFGKESEAFPIERRAAARTEGAAVTHVAVFRVDLDDAALSDHLRIGKIAGPAERAARALLQLEQLQMALSVGSPSTLRWNNRRNSIARFVWRLLSWLARSFADTPDALPHLLLEVLVDLVEEAFGRQPFLVGADEKRQILGHEAGLDRLDADFFQRVGEFGEPLVRSSLARCARPRVQAKIDAMELVEVALPF